MVPSLFSDMRYWRIITHGALSAFVWFYISASCSSADWRPRLLMFQMSSLVLFIRSNALLSERLKSCVSRFPQNQNINTCFFFKIHSHTDACFFSHPVINVYVRASCSPLPASFYFCLIYSRCCCFCIICVDFENITFPQISHFPLSLANIWLSLLIRFKSDSSLHYKRPALSININTQQPLLSCSGRQIISDLK